jgi:hypothetical protein
MRVTAPFSWTRGLRPGPAVLGLIPVVLAAFLPVLENGFVNFDDEVNFLGNPSFRGLGRPQIAWAWTTRLAGVYQPLSWMLLEAEYAAWRLDPRGYHGASLALYALDVIALYALTVRLLARCRPGRGGIDSGSVRLAGCLSVGLFAVHPLRVEVVAWASCQPYLVSAGLSLLAVLAYLRAQGAPPRVHRGWLAPAGSDLLGAAAMLSKAVAVPLPLVLLILDVYPLGRLGPGRWSCPEARRAYREKVPLAIVGAIVVALAMWARAGGLAPFSGYGPTARVFQAFLGAGFYLAKTFVPLGISACYPLPLHWSPAEPRFVASAVAVLAVTVGLVVLRRRWPGALAAWLVYLVLLAPSSGLVRMGPCLAADRYGFLPMMALVVPAAAGVEWLVRPRAGRWRRLLRGGVFCAIVAAGGVLVLRTREQCRTWRTSGTLWSHALAVSTEPNPFACRGLGMFLAGDPATRPAAEALLTRAVRMVPDDPDLANDLGLLLVEQGRPAEGLVHIRNALRLDADHVQARINLGNSLAARGDLAGAIAAYRAALRVAPADPIAHANLGMALLLQGRLPEAETHLVEALRLDPGAVEARRALEDLRRSR